MLSATTLGFSAGKVLVLPADAAGLHSGQHCERAWSRWVLHVSGIASKERVGATDHDFHKEEGFLLPIESKEDSVWSSGVHWDRHDVAMADGATEWAAAAAVPGEGKQSKGTFSRRKHRPGQLKVKEKRYPW